MRKLTYLFLISTIILTLTGCFKRDNFEDITIYTTAYPIEYITSELYGEHSEIKSIYPDGSDIKKYDLNSKQIKDYSKGSLFIFNGIGKEETYVSKFVKHNKNLLIIDASQSIEYTYNEDELWLDPSNFLMISRNIKNGLLEYIENHYLKEEITNNYDDLKLRISKIDATLKVLYENATHKTIITDNNTLKFLEKYGFTVISLEDNNGVSEKNLVDAKKLIENKTVKYIFTLSGTEVNNTVTTLVKTTNVELLEINNLSNITDKQRSEKEDYFSLLNENIEMLKKELY
ncbi:MAG: zinc ABC transporter substrate-binding protein [Lactobacillales bacterium]|nr:zinc ABC transporter substrate-binding protein [Lactobacillales bacterium]